MKIVLSNTLLKQIILIAQTNPLGNRDSTSAIKLLMQQNKMYKNNNKTEYLKPAL